MDGSLWTVERGPAAAQERSKADRLEPEATTPESRRAPPLITNNCDPAGSQFHCKNQIKRPAENRMRPQIQARTRPNWTPGNPRRPGGRRSEAVGSRRPDLGRRRMVGGRPRPASPHGPEEQEPAGAGDRGGHRDHRPRPAGGQPKGAGPASPVFGPTGEALANLVYAAARAAGLGDGFSGHSGRIGMAWRGGW